MDYRTDSPLDTPMDMPADLLEASARVDAAKQAAAHRLGRSPTMYDLHNDQAFREAFSHLELCRAFHARATPQSSPAGVVAPHQSSHSLGANLEPAGCFGSEIAGVVMLPNTFQLAFAPATYLRQSDDRVQSTLESADGCEKDQMDWVEDCKRYPRWKCGADMAKNPEYKYKPKAKKEMTPEKLMAREREASRRLAAKEKKALARLEGKLKVTSIRKAVREKRALQQLERQLDRMTVTEAPLPPLSSPRTFRAALPQRLQRLGLDPTRL